MATTQPVVKLTYEDYRTTSEDERYELLDGDLVMVAAPNLRHQTVLLRLTQGLGQFIDEHKLGKLFFSPCDVVLSDADVVQPDLLFVSREREHLLSTGENVQGAPDLVVEILSPATADRDRGYKRELYGRHCVREYWLVDPTPETVLSPSATRGHADPRPHLQPGPDAPFVTVPRPRDQPRRHLRVLTLLRQNC